MKATHDNGYTGEIREDGALFIDDADGNEVLTARHCTASTEEGLLSILDSVPSFLAGIKNVEAQKSRG